MRILAARADIQVPAGVVGPEPVTFDVHAFVVRDGDDIAIVDTLMQPGHVDLIANALAELGASFEVVRFIVLTHHHPDHTGGLAHVVERAPQAQVLAGEGDVRAIRSATGVAVDSTGAGDTVAGWQVVPAPGHTAGHLCLLDPHSSTMLLGDAVGNVGHLERGPAQFTEDADRAEATLRDLANRDVEQGLPSHGGPFADASRAIRALVELPA